MRRTVIIIVIAAFLFGSAANGSKKPRVSTAAATSHKKSQNSARRTASSRRTANRGNAHRASSNRRLRSRHATQAMLVTRFHPLQETAAPSDSLPAVESASLSRPRFMMPAPLRGSYESLVRQNEKSEEADNLERIQDDDDLADRIASGMLVPVPVSASLAINGNLPQNRRYCRPWTASFLADLSRAHASQFHAPLMVTSAVRTVEYQKKLGKTNGNAAAAEGDIASPHLTGATIDIAKQGLSRKQIAWMRARLLSLQEAGKIDVEEEFQQSCFHITVYKSYVPPKPPASSKPTQTAKDDGAPAKSSKTIPTQRKTARRKPAQAPPAQPKPDESEPAQPSPASRPEAPVEGL